MPRTGITKEEVADAVAVLRTQGKPTSTRVVRLELRRGSYATIGKFLDELGAKGKARPPDLPEIPEIVQRRLAESAYAMWEAMAKEARAQALEVQVQHEQRLRTVAACLAHEQAARRRFASELSDAVTQASAFKARGETAELELAGVRERLAVTQALLTRSEREREELLDQLAPLIRTAVPSAKGHGSARPNPRRARGRNLPTKNSS